MTTDDLVVDRQFAAVNSETHQRVNDDLRSSVLNEKRFRDPIRFWILEGSPLVVDGHRRLKLWNSLPKDSGVAPPRLEEMKFKNRIEAEWWMRIVSTERRNLSARDYALHRGRAIKLRAKLLAMEGEVSGQSVQKPPTTRKKTPKPTGGRPKSTTRRAVADVAKQTGVSEKTAERDLQYVEALDAIGAVNQKAKSDIASGALDVAKSTVIEIGAMDRTEIGKAIGNVRNGREWNDGIGKRQKPLEIPQETDALNEATALIVKLEAIIEDIPEDDRGPVAVRLRKMACKIDPPPVSERFTKPTVADVAAYCEERKNGIDPQAFVDFYESKGWLIGKAKMKDWRAAVRTWEKEHKNRNGHTTKGINDDAFNAVFGGK